MMDILRKAFTCVLISIGLHQSVATDARCKDSWTFHAHTVTCMKLIDIESTYRTASGYCQSHVGGPNGDQAGWLVSIRDEKTDMFVQNLVTSNQEAFIGLSKVDGQWVWADQDRSDSGYRRWKEGNPKTEILNSYKYVAMTKDGWETVKNDPSLKFVCEMLPNTDAPVMTCPPCEEGKPALPVTCSVYSQSSYGSLEDFSMNTNMKSPLVSCNSKRCTSFADKLVAMITNENNNIWKTAVNLERPTSREDNGVKWSCSVKFEKTRSSFLSAHCTRKTFVPPKSVECTHIFSALRGVEVKCSVHGIFPKAESKWSHYIDGQKKSTLSPETSHDTSGDDKIMYDAHFTKEFKEPGQHKIDVVVNLELQFFDDVTKNKASVERTVDFVISVPDGPPFFSTKKDAKIENGLLLATVGQSVILVCQVDGGNPQVHTTTIECDNKHVKDVFGRTSWSNVSHIVSVELNITKAMDQKVCMCEAQHVTGQYKKATTITFKVEDADIIINQGLEEVEVDVGKRVRFRCVAGRNLYKLGGGDIAPIQIKKTSGIYNSFDIGNASCEMSGRYTCLEENVMDAKTSEHRVNLLVRCPLQPCSDREANKEFSVISGRPFSFRICIFAYPAPHVDIRVRRTGREHLDKKDYVATLEYIDTLRTKAYIVVNMSSSITEIGNYTIQIWQSVWHTIGYSLVPYQRPSCPESFDTKLIGSTFITLFWHPAFDRGIPQTFTVHAIDQKGDKVDIDSVLDDGGKVMTYNVTGLDELSDYCFQLSIRNDEGLTECPHLSINVTTKALPVSESSSSDGSVGTVMIYVVTISIILVLIIVLAIVLVKRKKGTIRKEKTNQPNHASLSDHSRDLIDKSDPVIGDLYATVNKPKRKIEPKPDQVYNNEVALEMHKDHNKSKSVSEENGMASKDNPVIESTVYNNTCTLYANSNTSDKTCHDDDDASKTKNKKSSNTKSKKKNTKKAEACDDKKEPTRHKKNKEDRQNKELVYVEVEIVPGEEKFRVKPAEHTEPVDYASLNFRDPSLTAAATDRH
ncbi:hypothetical protein EGW08_015394 [Elysia chlorotica]|uniref:C-type lectin domain-containing protein n=1 Tax=Elysia chlorotica TaxID=188477 RepID=A0A3S1HCX9_ELYCH|nr:hypothetical protein EGW08_015394 [Elysia chlorotica]